MKQSLYFLSEKKVSLDYKYSTQPQNHLNISATQTIFFFFCGCCLKHRENFSLSFHLSCGPVFQCCYFIHSWPHIPEKMAYIINLFRFALMNSFSLRENLAVKPAVMSVNLQPRSVPPETLVSSALLPLNTLGWCFCSLGAF